jgi:hypothetical protein
VDEAALTEHGQPGGRVKWGPGEQRRRRCGADGLRGAVLLLLLLLLLLEAQEGQHDVTEELLLRIVEL